MQGYLNFVDDCSEVFGDSFCEILQDVAGCISWGDQVRPQSHASLFFNDRPLSPQQVLEAAQTEVEGLGIATVYRNIKALLEEGWLVPVDLPGSATVYERAGKAHHHHFHCERCSRVFDLAGCLPNINRLAGRKFLMVRHKLVL